MPQHYYYFQQLSSNSGIDLHPSDKDGTAGKRFLDSVKTFFESGKAEVIVESDANIDQQLNLDYLLCDLKHEEFDNFQKLGILRIHSREGQIIQVDCLATGGDDDDEVAMREYVEGKLGEFQGLVLQFQRFELLASQQQ